MFPNIFMRAMDRIANEPEGGSGRTGAGRIADLLGVVLCGGESRRMGRDKGLLLKDGVPWAKYVGQRLFGCTEVFYSINSRQREAYSELFPANRLIVDALDIPGPLNGLLSAHRLMPGPDILL